MLSSQAYSLRQKSRLAISLSWIAGYTNAIAVLFCARTVSHGQRDAGERDALAGGMGGG